MSKLFRILLLLMITHFSVHAQADVKGKAIDDKTGQGIGFVTVSLLSMGDSGLVKGQIADSTGVFVLSGILPGKYILQLSSYGYGKLFREALFGNTVNGIMDLGDLSMQAVANQLTEVVVTGVKPAFERLADKLILNISGNRLFATATNVIDILKKAPGLEVSADGTILMSGRITPGVFIDGKPVLMSAEELQNYLSSLSPDMIASIEVITNPSSRYDGEYKGIIDIKLKKDMTLGWKGNANINLQQNAYTLVDNTALLTYKTKQLTYTARLGYTTGKNIYEYNALQHLANTNIMATNTRRITGNNNFNYQIGADYTFKKGQHLEVILRAFRANREANAFNTLHITDSAAQNLVSHTNSINSSAPTQHNYAANLNYSALIGKTQLEMLGTIVKISNRQNEDIQTRDNMLLLDYWKTILKNDILIRSGQIDLSQNLGKAKLLAGSRFSFTTTKNDIRYDTLGKQDVFRTDSSRTNNFHYNEYITAAYISYERSGSKWSYSLSLRAEHTHSNANAVTQSQVIIRDYLTWLPSFNLNYRINSGKQLNLSYSRRMTRPNFAQLNPFRFYISPLNYFVGNPYLQPSKTSMLSIAYTQQAFNASLQIGRESDPMSRYPEYDSVTNVLEYLGRNLPYNDFAGIEISFPVAVNKWWRMSHNIRGNYKKEITPYHGVTYAIPIYNYTISGSQVFTLPLGMTFDISYYYRSISGSGLYIIKPEKNVDLGWQKSWMQGKLNTKINYYDIFNTYLIALIFREKKLIDNQLSHWAGNRRITLTFSYNFGKSTYKAKQTGKNEEEGRAGM